VVSIFTAQIVRESPLGGWPLFDGLLGRVPRDRIQRSLGTGFILDTQGYVLTNYHVVRGAQEILVTLEDGQEVSATPVGAEPGIDVALLHVQAADLTPAVLGDSDALEVGEWVLAIGNPFGLSQTVTAGIVSAKGRASRELGMNERGYQNFIQTDASINPGNSGGPLINTVGEVVGMNTAVSSAGQGIGFAVPINMVKAILSQLRRTGRVAPAWLGISVAELPPQLSSRYGLNPQETGVMVTDVYPGTPAAGVGVEPGDIVVAFNGQRVGSAAELSWLTATAGIGNTVSLALWRAGKRHSLDLKVTAKPLQRG
jgi:S1-C subfamily serine protease